MGKYKPKPYTIRHTQKRLAVFDSETDPFSIGCDPKPFTCCFYDGTEYTEFWGTDCIHQFFAWLSDQSEEYLIYAHNGGNFDFHFMLDYLDDGSDPFIIGTRLVKISLGGQEFRDSYSIIPVPLADFSKIEFDYTKMELGEREKNREEILYYQRDDCKQLFTLVSGFHEMFGDRLTMAGAALPMLNSMHGFGRIGAHTDQIMRPYFYGGRNQCFETGILIPKKKWEIYDRNSMYPTVMRDNLHPISGNMEWGIRINSKTCFAKIEARNDNCLPSRAENGSLDFTRESGVFFASIHEINAGLETGTLRIIRVLETCNFEDRENFGEFVEKFYTLRLLADAEGNKAAKLFYKLLLNSSYGKFALNPLKFENIFFSASGALPQGPMATPDNPEGWFPSCMRENSIFWSRPSEKRNNQFINVATAASITGAARADLHRAICLATRPIYCDTDSVICEGLGGVTFDEKELGAWKTEASGDIAAIAGKKMYAVFDKEKAVKKASKGVRLTAEQIRDVANGEVIEYANPVPKFNLDGSRTWINRRIQMTGQN